MQFIDSHCHLDFSEFDSSRVEDLQFARNLGVSAIVVPGITAEKWPRLQRLVSAEADLYAALGLHPCFMQKHTESHLEQLAAKLAQGGVCAVGEIGLDLFIPDADLDRQMFFLKAQLGLAQHFKLPVLLHVRKAHDQMLKALRQEKLQSGGIVHAFSGSEQQAQQYLNLGFKLGMGGTVTYERAKKVRRLVRNFPLDAFVLETDAPDMPLSGYQGSVNKPAQVVKVAEVIAQLKGMPVDEVAAITCEQVRALLPDIA